MSQQDSIPLIGKSKNKAKRKTEKLEQTVPREHDDIAGVIVSAGRSINVREMIIIWLWFLIIHSEIFIDSILTKIPSTVDDQKNMTLNGTIAASIIMIIGVIIIDMVYR